MTEIAQIDEIDLDAARAARAEAKGQPRRARFGGEVFELPVEIPFEAAEAMTHDRIGEGLAMLLGPAAYGRFMAHEPTIEDVVAFAEGLATSYGFDGLGESRPSPRS